MKKKKVHTKNVHQRRRAYRGIGLAMIGFVCVLVMMGIFWYVDSKKPSYAEEDNTWVNWDLATMVEPENHSDMTLTTARATFYDVYSDSQVWDAVNGDYYDKVQPITDGVTASMGNTFTRFNYELATSLNENGKEYQHMYDHDKTGHVEGVYPLYCGLTWPAQYKKNDGVSSGLAGYLDDTDAYMVQQRWGGLTTDKTFGWWFAAANTNQYSNDDKLNQKVSVVGVPGTAKGAAAQGLVNRELEDGNITIGHGEYKRVLPYFDQEYLEQPYEAAPQYTFYVVVKKSVMNNKDFAPRLYLHDGYGNDLNGKWPGEEMISAGDYYVYGSTEITGAKAILTQMDNTGKVFWQSPGDGQEPYVSGSVEWNGSSFVSRTRQENTGENVSHGYVVSNIAFPFRKGGTTYSGLKIQVKKSDYPLGAPQVHLYEDNGTVLTGAWPGATMKDDGEYYTYTNENITGKVNAVFSYEGTQDPPSNQGAYSVSGSVEYDRVAKKIYDTSKVYFSDENGEATDPDYYYFDSYSDVIQLDEVNKRVDYYHGEQQIQDSDGINGFFPYNKAEEVNADNTNLNYVHGVKMELTFNMTGDGKIKGKDITFEFTGDDDLWVFVDGYLVLDIGGAHIPISGNINFATKKATVDYVKPEEAFIGKDVTGQYLKYRDGNYGVFDTDVEYDFGKNSNDPNGAELYELLSDTARNHTLTIFYMERGKGNSNLKIKFNLPQISTMSVGNEVDASDVNKSLQTEALWKACNEHNFQYVLENKGTEEADYNNSITEEVEPIERIAFTPMGLAPYRKKVTSEDGVPQRLRFFTFAGTNYFSMVVGGTQVSLPTLRGNGAGETEPIVDENGRATINGKEYVFLGWTKDETYRDHWEEIQNGTYTGTCPKLETDSNVTVNESTDYYAVWVPKTLTVTYYDEADVDTPLGYQQAGDGKIGSETLDMAELTKGYVNGSNVITWWKDDVLSEDKNETALKRANWKTDETRKGFTLNGWRLGKMKEDGDNDLISSNYFPLCNVKLYADWSRTCYRAQFQVKDAEQSRMGDGTEKAIEDGIWKSNILYFPVGSTYKGYLPYMTDSSDAGDFKVVTEDITYFDFDSLPVWDNHAIVRWVQNDKENTSYRTTKLVENGKTLYPQEWTSVQSDVVFEGEWKQITSYITYNPGNYPEGLDWKSVKKKYTLGQTVYSPSAGELFGSGDTGDWDIVGWQQDGTVVSFPYTVTEDNVTWTAVWKKVSGTVTYHFNDDDIGIKGIDDYVKTCKVGSVIEQLTLEGMGETAPYDSVGSVGEKGSHITHYVKVNGNAYVITGWKDSNGDKVNKNTQVPEDGCDVYAIWEEAYTTLEITVVVKNEDKDEWNEEIATKNGWTKKSSNGGTTWNHQVDLVPGETFDSYFNRDSGELKKILYGADESGSNSTKDIKYNTIVYPGGNFQLEGADADKNARVPYTAGSHNCIVTGSWELQNVVITFAYLDPSGNSSSSRVIGYQSYSLADIKQGIALPKMGDILLDSDGNNGGSDQKVPEQDGYELSGWSLSESAEVYTQAREDLNKAVLYTVWNPVTAETNSSSVLVNSLQESVVQKSVVQKSGTSVMQLFGFASDKGQYEPVANELYELDDLLVDKTATGRSGSDGTFSLTYDQIASFMNCFSINSNMRLKEENKIYDASGNLTANTSDMYTTTWELRDIHGYITSRMNSKDLKQMPVSDNGEAVVYDGRVDREEETAFKFTNENDAANASYATSLRALFTHKIKTSDLTITKKLTDTAASVAIRKGEEDQDYIFKVYFYNIFGDASNTERLLYEGTYQKLDKYGNYIRDDENNIETYTAKNGKIIVKNGESAIITGIPVQTKYDIEEEDAVGKKDTYVLSYAQEITAKGLASENKKYVVYDINEVSDKQLLKEYSDGVYEKEVINNREVLQGKKLAEFEEISSSFNRKFSGQIETAGYTYNYVVENEVLIDGISLYIEKIIDEFYYDDNDRFYDDVTYQELSKAKQTFIFKIKYTPVDENGNIQEDKIQEFEQVVTFDPEDGTLEAETLPTLADGMNPTNSKGYKKTVIVLGLEPGYYEVSEDEEWSWKYDLVGTYEKIQKTSASKSPVYEAESREAAKSSKNNSKKSYRCYIRGIKETVNKDYVTLYGENYRVLDNAEEPNVSFLNLKAIDEREDILGDTTIKTNTILMPTPTPNPYKYKGIVLDDAYNGKELLNGEQLVIPYVKATKQDGSVETLTSDSDEWNNLTWTSSASNVVKVDGNKLTAVGAGTATITVRYVDGDDNTSDKIIHTASIEVKVVVAGLLDFTSNRIPYELIYSSQKSSNPATFAIDKIIQNDKLWITTSETYGENIYWGLLFKDTSGKYATRKINHVKVYFEPKYCERKIALYGITSVTSKNSFEKTLIEIQTLYREKDILEFNVPLGDYYGIQIVFLSREGDMAYPALSEVEITGY